MSILLLAGGLLCSFFYYRFLEKRENHFIKGFVDQYGAFIGSATLDFFSVGGKDKLRWGLKLYVYPKGIVIGDPFNESLNICLPLNEIKEFSINGRRVSFYGKLKGSYLPVKFELSGGPFDKSLPALINQTC